MRIRAVHSLGSDVFIQYAVFHRWIRARGHIGASSGKIKPVDKLIFVKAGTLKIIETGLICKEGELLYVPRFSLFTLCYEEDYNEVYTLSFRLMDSGGEFQLSEHPALAASIGSGVDSIFHELFLNHNSSRMGKYLYNRELLYRLLRIMAENSVYSQCKLLEPGIDVMVAHLSENLPVEEYARACRLSVVYFRRLFRRYFGMTPVEYRNQLRLERANELLAIGDCNVAEAALQVGFESSSYFCKMYKRYYGVSPGTSRR